MGLISSVFGGNKAYKKSIRDLEKAKSMEMDYYNRIANGDLLEDSANQAAIRQARELLKKNNQRAIGSAAVTGATDASVALQKKDANESVEDITAGIAANGSAVKRNAMDNYLAANRNYTNAINQVRVTQAQQESAALQGLIGAGTSLATGLIGANIAKKKE